MSGQEAPQSRRAGDLAFIGDVHLEPDDATLPDFLAFLDLLADRCSRIVFVGDLFNIWIGRKELEQQHTAAVLSKLVALRNRGLVVRYLEGNRDFRVGACYTGTALDETSEQGLTERFAGLRIFVAHGDLANADDRRYRLWRRFVRSPVIWGLFNMLPKGQRLRLAQALERRLRETNIDFKIRFPEAAVCDYASRFLGAGHDLVVLGHFHIEKDLIVGPPRSPGRILVLPEWKGSRRYLEVSSGGAVRFVDSGG